MRTTFSVKAILNASAAIVICVIASPLHELGHWAGFALCGVPAGISFNHTYWTSRWEPCLAGDLGGPVVSLLAAIAGLLLARRAGWRVAGLSLAFFMAMTRLVPYLFCLMIPGMHMAHNDEGVAAALLGLPLWTFAIVLAPLFGAILLSCYRTLRAGNMTKGALILAGILLYVGLVIILEGGLIDPRLFPSAHARELVMPAQ